MAANDLIGPQQAPGGDIVGLLVRAGDTYHMLGNGPIVQGVDPITGLTRIFRYNVLIQDNGDGTTTAIPTLDEVTLT